MKFLILSIAAHALFATAIVFSLPAARAKVSAPWVVIEPVPVRATAAVGKKSSTGEKSQLPMSSIIAEGNAVPSYPREAIENGWEGQVRLLLTIADDGKVEKVELIRSAGFDCLDRAAMDRAPSWRFSEAEHVGRQLEVPVQFLLEDERG